VNRACLLLLLLIATPHARGEAMLQLFNQSWVEVTEKIPEIAEAGYTSLWLPPPAKAMGGSSVGYDLFDPFDLGDKNQRGTIRTLYGTKDELLEMVRIAHRFGLRVYFDNIMNHRGGEVPGYNQFVPTNLYPGMVPADFHLRTISGGFFRNVSNIRDYNDVWQVQNLSLLGLVDIAHENPNTNFGPNEGDDAPKPVFVRHPNNPEYYLGQTPYAEDVNAYLQRSVRWLFQETKCDGLRLDAVKHVPSYFFGQQTGGDKDFSHAGYLGGAQLQFNIARGFSDENHRNSNFDSETTRNDALLFGEHLGQPPSFGEYVDAGMRLLDNQLRDHLNNVLGNPSATLAGLDQRDGGGLAAAVRVMHAQSHDNDFAARRELQNAYYFLREGIPLIYTDGYNESPSGGGTPFPRHANAPYLGQFGDRKMPDLAWLHHQCARGGTSPRWADNDIVAFERYDYREATAPQDRVVALFVMNDNYGFPGDISFDDGVAQSDSGMPSTCYPAENSRGQGLVVAFPPGSRLRQLADSPGKSRACPELLVRLATNVRNDAIASQNDPNSVNRKVYVGSQTLSSGGGAVELKIPSGSYVVYGYQWPEPSRVDTTLSNATGVVAGTDVIVLQQDGRTVPRVMLQRHDGPDGDSGFNPLYPFKMRGSMDLAGNVITGNNLSNFTYTISVPIVTNPTPLTILVHTDASAESALLKLDGGIDLNSHMNLGASNTFTHGVLDLRDNKPGTATDVFLGYESTTRNFRYGPEKFAARNTSRNNVYSESAETYAYEVGPSGTNYLMNGAGVGDDYSSETAEWVYHDPAANATVAGSPLFLQRSSTASADPVDLWVKVGYQLRVSRCFLYYTTDGSAPEGAFGVPRGTTQVAQGAFGGSDSADATIDWWRATIPAHAIGTTVKYRIGLFKHNAAAIADYPLAKYYGLTEFAITDWDPATAQVWLHNDLATTEIATGLADGFHILRARVFLPRVGKSSVYNTFLQTFYYDTRPPDGVIAFPPNDGATLRSTDYGVVVRTDETVAEVEYNIVDGDPNNDDAATGFNNGNGVNAFAKASRVSPPPGTTREFRFTYFAVPSNGTATITVRLKEISGTTRVLTRTVNAAAPPQTLSIAFPSFDGQTISLDQNASYTIVARFSDTLTADTNSFFVDIDGAFQPRANRYRFEDQTAGDGKHELRFDWSGMTRGQHLIEIRYKGDGLALEAARLVNVNLLNVQDTDGDGLPDNWENQYTLNPNDSTDVNGANGDPDNDHFTNIQEYLAGTNPRDPFSLLRIVGLSGGGQRITWQSVPGKRYQVYSTPSPAIAFEPLSGGINAFESLTHYTNSGPPQAHEFFKVRVLP
jgi:glycosidase